MLTNQEMAKNLLGRELDEFASGKPDDYFHPMNRDYWVRSFCEWLSAKQRRSAEVRASND